MKTQNFSKHYLEGVNMKYLKPHTHCTLFFPRFFKHTLINRETEEKSG